MLTRHLNTCFLFIGWKNGSRRFSTGLSIKRFVGRKPERKTIRVNHIRKSGVNFLKKKSGNIVQLCPFDCSNQAFINMSTDNFRVKKKKKMLVRFEGTVTNNIFFIRFFFFNSSQLCRTILFIIATIFISRRSACVTVRMLPQLLPQCRVT